MKTLLLLATLCMTQTVFAASLCSYRFNSELAVSLRLDDYLDPRQGRVSWDDANTCTAAEDGTYLCTEIYPGSYAVTFKNYTPSDTSGAVRYRIRSIHQQDDLGNRYRNNKDLKLFVRKARFLSALVPAPNLTMTIGSNSYEMACATVE